MLKQLVENNNETIRLEKKRQLEDLFVKAAFVPKSSGSSRSPRRDDDRFELKQQTIEFYGLWATSSTKKTTTTNCGFASGWERDAAERGQHAINWRHIIRTW